MDNSFLKKINGYDVGFLLLPMSCYLLSFFLQIDSRLNNNIFYIFVLVPFLLFIEKKQLVKDLATSTIFKLSIIFALYLVVRSAFYFNTDLVSYVKPARHFISWAAFMSISIGLFLQSKLFERITVLTVWAAIWGLSNLIHFYSTHDMATRLVYNGPVSHEILGASVYAFLCVLAALTAMRPQQESFGKFIVSIVLFFCVFMSQSRGVILAVILSIVAAIPFVRIRMALPLIVGSGLFLGLFFSLFSENLDRITQLTTSYRIDIWLQVLKNSLSDGYWLFGNSLTASHEIVVENLTFHHMHSGYVGTYFYGGVIGGTILLMLILTLGYKVYTIGKSAKDPVNVGLYVFLVLIISTDNHRLLDGPSEIWFYFWLPVAFLAAKELHNKQDSPVDVST